MLVKLFLGIYIIFWKAILRSGSVSGFTSRANILVAPEEQAESGSALYLAEP
jgi:hypothetical protein